MQRYAIYHAPRPGPLADAAAAWLGWDAAAGCEMPAPDGLTFDWQNVTAAPRKYGFHGTLKAPFRLADGCDFNALRDATDALAARSAPVFLDAMVLAQLGGFMALVPQGDASALNRLAADVVTGLDGFRAAPTEAELARRGIDRMTDRQRAYMLDWGYPYVFDEFRFHLTLTGKLDGDPKAVRAALEARILPHVPAPYLIEDLCLFGQGDDGRFHLLHRARLSG